MKAILLVLFLVSLGFSTALEIIVTEEELQTKLEECIDDTRITSLDVDIQDGIILLTAIREMPMRDVELAVEIWLDPGSSAENVWAVKSGTADGEPFGDARIEYWNQWFNLGMERMAGTELGRADEITIEPDQITLIWRNPAN